MCNRAFPSTACVHASICSYSERVFLSQEFSANSELKRLIAVIVVNSSTLERKLLKAGVFIHRKGVRCPLTNAQSCRVESYLRFCVGRVQCSVGIPVYSVRSVLKLRASLGVLGLFFRLLKPSIQCSVQHRGS